MHQLKKNKDHKNQEKRNKKKKKMIAKTLLNNWTNIYTISQRRNTTIKKIKKMYNLF